MIAQLLIAIMLLAPLTATAYEILAFGTSNTNSKNVERSKSFTAHLQDQLRAKGHDVTVVNAGVDGDKPFWMINRMPDLINGNTRLVIFEPGPNDRNKSSNVEYSEKILAELQQKKLRTIYISHGYIQTEDEGRDTALKYGALYYGHWHRNVPKDREHFQFDQPPPNLGHMTAEGCQMVANQILPLVEMAISERLTASF
ncbi:MAG: hypothetical protein M0Q22_13810 [Sulfuritalea sp.]|nr:hypothetical protein [Sulfuritalea sp.]